MVTQPARVIPKHTACLSAQDFWQYLTPARRWLDRNPLSAEQVWGARLQRPLWPTPTGRHALWYFLEQVDLPAGSQVLVAGYNFYVIVRLLVQKGLVPVFVDIDPETLCLDAADLARKVSERSRLVVVTHMFGNPANLAQIVAVCQQAGLLLFEDCAHAVGTLWQGRQVGQMGDGALFSFGVQKIVNSFGGGLLVLSEQWGEPPPPLSHQVSARHSFTDTFARFATSLFMDPRLYGWVLYPAMNWALALADRGWPQLQATIDPSKDNPDYRFVVDERAPFKPFMLRMQRRQLQRLDANIARRRAIAEQIKARLAPIDAVQGLNEDKHGRSNTSYFGLYVPNPDALARYLAQYGIQASPHEYYDCARLTQFQEYGGHCPHASQASDHILRLPNYPCLGEHEIEHIASTIERFFVGRRQPAPVSGKGG